MWGCSSGVKRNMLALSAQEGSGFDDFDSDDEVLRVSELLLDLHHSPFSSFYKFNIHDVLSLGAARSSWTPRTARASRGPV